MTVAVGNILKNVFQAKVNGLGTRVQNIYSYEVLTVVDGDEAEVFNDMTAELLLLYAIIGDWLSSDFIAEHVRTTNETAKEFVGEDAVLFAGGGAAGASTPAQICVEVLARARKLGHVARKYIGPVIEAAHTDGVLVALALTDFKAFADQWDSEVTGLATGNTYKPVMVAYAEGGAVSLVTDIEAGLNTVQPVARTQRRRIPGEGLS